MLKKLLFVFSILLAYFFFSLLGPLWVYLNEEVDLKNSWSSADRSSVGLAPDPSKEKEAVLQMYVARTYNWRGLFAVHPWIAYKEKGEEEYRVIEVLGWRAFRGQDSILIQTAIPDRKWFGNLPRVIFTANGEKAERIMRQILKLTENYPYRFQYSAYPGPNSNTYMAYLIDNIPELDTILPAIAIGQRYPIHSSLLSFNRERHKITLSLWGHAGLVLGLDEGLRFFLFGVEWGVNPWQLFVVVPGIGQIPERTHPEFKL